MKLLAYNNFHQCCDEIYDLPWFCGDYHVLRVKRGFCLCCDKELTITNDLRNQRTELSRWCFRQKGQYSGFKIKFEGEPVLEIWEFFRFLLSQICYRLAATFNRLGIKFWRLSDNLAK